MISRAERAEQAAGQAFHTVVTNLGMPLNEAAKNYDQRRKRTAFSK